MGTCAEMLREKFKQRPCKNESTDALYRDRLARSSDEAPVMGVERRGQLIQRMNLNN
ncbi:hypothetical protein [Phocaeicola dorei]